MVNATTNTISTAGATINFATSDNDLYIEDILEVDGTIYQAGNQVCDTSGNCAGTTNYWQRTLGVIAPGNAGSITDDLAIGGAATASASFQAFGIETVGGNVAKLASDTITTGR